MDNLAVDYHNTKEELEAKDKTVKELKEKVKSAFDHAENLKK
jgi:cell division protein FtsB